MKFTLPLLPVTFLALCSVSSYSQVSTSSPYPESAFGAKNSKAYVSDFGDKQTRDATALKTIVIELDLPSVAEFVVEHKKEYGEEPSPDLQRAHAKKVSAQQASLAETLASFVDIEHVSNLRIGINGLKCRTEQHNIERIRSLNGVKSVKPVAHHKIQQSSNSADSSRSNAVRKALKGLTGKGVVIAIVDDGIDYTHKNFGGSGKVSDYKKNNKNRIEKGTFPTKKVIGGYDLAGPDYSGSPLLPGKPKPDPDPLPGGTHGTNSASVAAGFGIKGVLDPGIAPDAKLLAIKVMGDGFLQTELGADGIEVALDPNRDGSVDDRADIINLSLGQEYGVAEDEKDFDAAIRMATKLGVVVVAAAGNSGDRIFVHSVPAVFSDVISVGSVSGVDAEPEETFALIVKSKDKRVLIPARYAGKGKSRLGNVKTTFGKLQHIAVELDCNQKRQYRTKVIMLDIRHLETACKEDEAKMEAYLASLKARAVLFYDVHSGNLFYNGNANGVSAFSSVISAQLNDPARDLLLEMAKRDGELVVGFNPKSKMQDTSTDNVISQFSSRGPATETYQLKPDVVAPGDGIVVAQQGSGRGTTTVRGTSFSSPYVAGMAALIKQRYKKMHPSSVKSLILSTSSSVYYGGDPGLRLPYDLSLQGLGSVNLAGPTAAQAVLSRASISFGRVNPHKPLTIKKKMTLRNLTKKDLTYKVVTRSVRRHRGLTVDAPDTLRVAAGGKKTFNITFKFDPKAMPVDKNRFDFSTVQGWVEFRDGKQTLRTAYYGVVDPASDLRVVGDKREQHIVKNFGTSEGVATAYDEVFTYSRGDFDHDILPEYKHMGVRLVKRGATEFYEFALVSKAVIRDAFPEKISLTLAPYHAKTEDYIARYIVGAGTNLMNLPQDLSGQTNYFSFHYNLNKPMKENIIRNAQIDFDDRWIKFLIPKKGNRGLDQFANQNGILDIGMEIEYLAFLDEETGEFNTLGGSQIVYFAFDSKSLNIVDKPVLRLKAGRSHKIAPAFESELPIMWLFEHNREHKQSAVVK